MGYLWAKDEGNQFFKYVPHFCEFTRSSGTFSLKQRLPIWIACDATFFPKLISIWMMFLGQILWCNFIKLFSSAQFQVVNPSRCLPQHRDVREISATDKLGGGEEKYCDSLLKSTAYKIKWSCKLFEEWKQIYWWNAGPRNLNNELKRWTRP